MGREEDQMGKESMQYDMDQDVEISERSRRTYPEDARTQYLFEIFEDGSHLLDHDQEGFALTKEGLHIQEEIEAAEERSERFMKAQRQITAGFFERRYNPLYRRPATASLLNGRPSAELLLLWSLLGKQRVYVDTDTEQEVRLWLQNLTDWDIYFFTKDPDMDPQRVSSEGIFPDELKSNHLLRTYRERLVRSLMKEPAFFHPSEEVFKTKLWEKIDRVADAWALDAEMLFEMAFTERCRLYGLHLQICKAAAALVHQDSPPASVPKEVIDSVAAVAHERMSHPEYKSMALSFAGIERDQAKRLFDSLDEFMQGFYGSRLFSFVKRFFKRRQEKRADLLPVIRTFAKTFRTGMSPKGLDQEFSRRVAAVALFDTYFGGFRGSSTRITGRPRTLYRPQILNWAGFATLQEAKEVYQAIPHPEVIARAFLSEVKKLKETPPKASGSSTQSKIVIRTRSIYKANPGDLATYRWGSLESFSDGRLFAPSDDLLRAYKRGAISWEEYEGAYQQEMRELFKRSPETFLDLLRNKDQVTLVCYEADPGRCHRRILAEIFKKIGIANGIHVDLDIH
jgi:hypothetical protein